MVSYDILGSSLLQSSYEFIEQCLENFKSIQPEFDYTLFYGTNLDNELVYENDKFNIVLYTGVVDKIPSHFMEVNGVNQILYAGYLDITLSVVCPISLEYTDDLNIYSQKSKEYNDNFLDVNDTNYGDSNLLSINDTNKIQLGTRLLEQLSLFLTRRNIEINNFDFSMRCDMPIIDSQVDVGVYRLVQSLTPMLKFVWLNDLGKATYSGEKEKVYITFKNSDYSDYETQEYEIFGVLETSEITTLIKKDYPIYNQTTINSIGNHYSRGFSVQCIDLDLGAIQRLNEFKNSGNIKRLQDVKVRLYDGKKNWSFYAVIDNVIKSSNLDRFSSKSISFTVVSEILEE